MTKAIYAFSHQHRAGDICSVHHCEYARRAPALSGSEVIEDLPMRIIRSCTAGDYLNQPVPQGYSIPPIQYGCEHFYEVEILD